MHGGGEVLVARKLQPCGTVAAYKRHLRRGEEACEECLAAKRQHQSQARAKERVPAVPVPVPAAPDGDGGMESELRWQVTMLKSAIQWAADNDPAKLPALAKERRETLAKLAELGDDESAEGGGLGEFFANDQPLSIVRSAEAEAREGA